MEHPFFMFLDHTQRRTTVGRTPLDKWSALQFLEVSYFSDFHIWNKMEAELSQVEIQTDGHDATNGCFS